MSFRVKGQKNPDYPHALAFWSVDTEEQARAIIVTHCRLAYDNKTHFLPDFSGEVDDVLTLSETLGLS